MPVRGTRIWKVLPALLCLALLAAPAGRAEVTLTFGGGRAMVFPEALDELVQRGSSRTYDPALSRLLAVLATAAYNDPDAGAEAPDAPLGKDAESVADLAGDLRALGFEGPGADFALFDYYKSGDAPGYGPDSAAFALARRPMANGETLVLAVIRGSRGTLARRVEDSSPDWVSNFRMETNRDGEHGGFAAAADRVFGRLREYLGGLPTEGVRYVITGHSRGAAVANLLAMRLHRAGVPNGRVFDYNFACPDVARRVDLGGLRWAAGHGNMYNICNTADLICAVPGALGDGMSRLSEGGWLASWGKFGKTLYFSLDGPAPYEKVGNTLSGGFPFGGGESSHSPAVYLRFLDDLPRRFMSPGEAALRQRTLARFLTSEEENRLRRLLGLD